MNNSDEDKVTDLPVPPPSGHAPHVQRRSNLVRDVDTGKIVKNDRKTPHHPQIKVHL